MRQFRRGVDGRMEGIDEMWMPCEYRRPYKVPVLGEPYSMYGGWARTEQGAPVRAPAVHRLVATRYPSCGRPRALARFLPFRQPYRHYSPDTTL